MMAVFKAQEMFIENAFEIPTIVIQFVFSLVMGRAIAALLPERVYRFRRTQFKFSLNPGPFNAKEQPLICVFAYIGTVRPSMVQTVVIARSYFQEDIYWPVAYIATLSSYLMSFLFVGLFMRHLVSSAHIWWPTELVDVVFFRAWHDDNAGSLGSISINKFFWIFFVLSSIYQLIAGFLFPSISYLSPLCWIWQNSRTVQQIGAGKNGLGLFSFSLDWSSLTSFTDNPLATPRVAILNLLVGYFIILFIVTPAVYWSNAFDMKKFPLMSTDSYDDNGQPYNISRVLNSNGTFNEAAYRDYSKMHLTAFSLSSYTLLFASVATSLVHIVLDRELYNKV